MDSTDGPPLVSIVIPARNEGAHIRACLLGVLDLAYPPARLEILVVDGRSTDETREVVRTIAATHSQVRLLDNPRGVTPSALNIGIRASTGGIIGLMSAHAVPTTDYLAQALQALSTPGAWGAGGRIERRAESSTQRAIAAATSSRVGIGNAAHNYLTHAAWVETAFPGLWPRFVFEQVGLFDEELVRNQDDELSFRIREAGGRIRYEPGAIVRYEPRSTLRGLFSQYRQYGMWKVRVFQKHPGAARPRHLIPPAFAAILLSGLMLTPFIPSGPILMAVALIPYTVLLVAAALNIGGAVPKTTFVAAIVILHVSYGLGFLQGLIRFLPRWFIRRSPEPEYLAPQGTSPR